MRRLGLAIEVLVAYVRVRRSLSRHDVRTTLRELRDRPLERRPSCPPANARAGRLAGGTVRVLRYLPGDTRCLSQSLVLSALLARRGVASRLVIAVRDPRRFGAHAWVEVEGRALLPPAGPRDARLVEL